MLARWVSAALERGCIEAVPADDRDDKHMVRVVEHPWYEEGIAFDWSKLHKCLKGEQSRPANLASPLNVIHHFVANQPGALVTSIFISKAWEMCPLDKQASSLSCFSLCREPGEPPQLYRFLKGPPGQRSVADDTVKMLRNISMQLNSAGIVNEVFLNVFVVRGNDFNELLQRTAGVYRALKAAGLNIDAAQSNLEPRAIVEYATGWWSTLAYNSLKVDDYPAFLADCFFTLLQDRYQWLCEQPVETSQSAVSKAFHRFLSEIIAPQRNVIMMEDVTVEKLDELFEKCCPLLTSRAAPPPGFQRWSALELRLLLAMTGAYNVTPFP